MKCERDYVRAGERLDDLQYENLYIIQHPGKFCFGTDAVLLCSFLRLKPGARAVDLGAGTGIVAILGGAKTRATFTCVEIQSALCDMARRSMAYNDLNVDVYCMDWRDAPLRLGYEAFDAAVCNPPYFFSGTGSPNPARAVSRHTRTGSILDACEAACQLLKNGGTFFIVYPTDGLVDAVCAMRANHLEPKRMRFVAKRAGTPPRRALIEAKKGAHSGLIVEPTLYLEQEDGSVSEDLKHIYGCSVS